MPPIVVPNRPPVVTRGTVRAPANVKPIHSSHLASQQTSWQVIISADDNANARSTKQDVHDATTIQRFASKVLPHQRQVAVFLRIGLTKASCRRQCGQAKSAAVAVLMNCPNRSLLSPNGSLQLAAALSNQNSSWQRMQG
jgi:hypothetical protein